MNRAIEIAKNIGWLVIFGFFAFLVIMSATGKIIKLIGRNLSVTSALSIGTRIQVIWAAVCCRPIMFRMQKNADGSLTPLARRGLMTNCVFIAGEGETGIIVKADNPRFEESRNNTDPDLVVYWTHEGVFWEKRK